jgi:hypothetical protein
MIQTSEVDVGGIEAFMRCRQANPICEPRRDGIGSSNINSYLIEDFASDDHIPTIGPIRSEPQDTSFPGPEEGFADV